jgi:subtilisin family serine protease
MAVLFALAVAVASVGLAGANSQPSSPGGALEAAAAQQHGLDADDLKVVKQSTVDLSLTGESYTEAKVLDTAAGRTYGVSLDSAGNAVDSKAAQGRELAAYRDRFGTMTRDLSRRVANSAPDGLVDVGFWLKSNHLSVATRPEVEKSASGPATIHAIETAEAASDRRVSAAVADVVKPFAADLRAGGNVVTEVGDDSPSVFARVKASDVARLAADDRVLATSYAGHRATETQDVAISTTATSKVFPKFVTGIGVLGGVVECCDSLFEEDPADLDSENNAYLARIHEGRAGACPGDHSHPTAVSGIIQSTHHKFTGIAKDVGLYFNSAAACDGSEAGVDAATDDVINNVSGATNHSYGVAQAGTEPACPDADDVWSVQTRNLDDKVRGFADSQYVAAGNDGNATCVGPPASAWNIVSVGAFDDNNTSGWAGDTMAAFSSGGDPSSNNGDRQKPEVAGPGVNFTGLLQSPGGFPTGGIGSGTSYASPVYAGGAALLEQQKPALLSWPEGEKAVMLASSCHNIEGAQTNSELDGAGGPDFFEMWNLLNANRFQFGSIANGTGTAVTKTFTGVGVGQEMRIALAWDTNTSYALYGNDPSDDLDLALIRPNGTVAANSASFDNTHEVIEFVADQAGTWTIQVNRFRTDDPAGSTFYGLAWHKYAPSACTAP